MTAPDPSEDRKRQDEARVAIAGERWRARSRRVKLYRRVLPIVILVLAGGVLTWNLGALRPKSEGGAWFKVQAIVGPTASTTATLADTSGQSRAATDTTTIRQPTAVQLDTLATAPDAVRWAPLAGLLLLMAGAVALRRRTVRS